MTSSWNRVHNSRNVPLIARFMGPTWGPSGADRTQVGPMLAPWILLSRAVCHIINPPGAEHGLYRDMSIPCHQVINNNGIEYAGSTGPCRPREGNSTTCAMPLLRNNSKFEYTFRFPKIYSTRQKIVCDKCQALLLVIRVVMHGNYWWC